MSAVAFIHSKNEVHIDLKPWNSMILRALFMICGIVFTESGSVEDNQFWFHIIRRIKNGHYDHLCSRYSWILQARIG